MFTQGILPIKIKFPNNKSSSFIILLAKGKFALFHTWRQSLSDRKAKRNRSHLVRFVGGTEQIHCVCQDFCLFIVDIWDLSILRSGFHFLRSYPR